MAWKECHVEDERLRFVARRLDGEKMQSARCYRPCADGPEATHCWASLGHRPLHEVSGSVGDGQVPVEGA